MVEEAEKKLWGLVNKVMSERQKGVERVLEPPWKYITGRRR